MSSRSRRQTQIIVAAGIIALCATVFFIVTFRSVDTERVGSSLTAHTSEERLQNDTAREAAATSSGAPGDTPTSKSTAAPGAPSAGSQAGQLGAVVTYTTLKGFEPSRTTIRQGEMVHFINQSDKKMWIGSDDHPTHTLYPERKLEDCLGSSFDECKAIGTGESWDFIFDAVGEWGYHNHMRARDTGMVIVTPAG